MSKRTKDAQTKNRAILSTESSESSHDTQASQTKVRVRIGKQNVQFGHSFLEASSEHEVTAAQAKRLGSLATIIS
jgi:hypothetical protein